MRKVTRIERIIRRINVPRRICDNVLDKKHTKSHRIGAGIIVMIIGVAIAKGTAHIDITIIHYLGDVLGYGFHGIGLTPVIEHFIEEEGEEI